MRTRLRFQPVGLFWLAYLASYATVVAVTIGAFT